MKPFFKFQVQLPMLSDGDEELYLRHQSQALDQAIQEINTVYCGQRRGCNLVDFLNIFYFLA